MAGYRRVNYYELCRLCTSSEGTKMHIFREEGRRRSLPSKIQKCLPLQVQEEDSLPKIICSTCVEKLESYYEFREACVNAEAMLESYFTSLKYSEDFTREGKVSVYVKDEAPKKKEEGTPTKVKIPVNNFSNVNSTTNINDTNSIQPSAIQLIADADGTRLTQYKVQVQGGIPSLIPVGPGGLPLSVSLSALTPPTVKQQSTCTGANIAANRPNDIGTHASEPSAVATAPPLVAAVAITSQNQELLQQLSKERNVVAELLKLKNVNIVDAGSFDALAASNNQIPGGSINNQLPNLVPAPIRLDHLNQLINSNLQVNLNPIQQTNQPEAVVENRSVIINRSTLMPSQPPIKTEGNAKINEDVNVRDQKLAATNVNGSSDRANNALGAKTNLNLNEDGKIENINLEEQVQEDGGGGGGGGGEGEGGGGGGGGGDGGDGSDGGGGGGGGEGTGIGTGTGGEVVQDGAGGEGGGGEVNETESRTAETEEKSCYDCEFCGKSFKRREHLIQHRKSHSGERPFVCPACDKAFSRKEHLLRHNVCHTGQKQYMCDVCKKSFSRKDNLLKHRKTHGINSPHVCEVCGKSFVVRHYYLMHKNQHKMPSDMENSSGTSVKHVIVTDSTTNPLPFKCDLCTKSFCMKEHLTSHRMRHRNKPVKKELPEEVQDSQQSSSEIAIPQPAVIASYPTVSAAGNLNLPTLNTQLTTINPNALLTPNILHHSSANVVHIGNNSYLCTTNVAQELFDQYRKIHSS